MNQNGSFPNFTIKPIEITSRPTFSQNWMNSPKSSNHIRILRQSPTFNPFQILPITLLSQTQPQTPSQPQIHSPPISQQNRPLEYPSINEDSGKFTTNANYQNLPHNAMEYDQMNRKLHVLEDRLAGMREKLNRKREARLKVGGGTANWHGSGSGSGSGNPNGSQEKKSRKSKSKSKQKQRQKQKNKQTQQNTDALKLLVSQINPKKPLKILNFDPYTQKHHTYYISQILRAYKQENSLAKDHLISSHQQLRALRKLRGPSQEYLEQKQMKLMRRVSHQGKKTIVFDLDETLIHCNENSEIVSDVKLKVRFPTGKYIEAGINVRPHVTETLKSLSRNFEIIVFTASHSTYANEVLNYLDPNNEFIAHRLFREHCYQTPQGMYIKDLRVLNRDLSQTVLIDNAAYSYCLQLENGIPIIPYYEGKTDFQLKALQSYLEGLQHVKDVRDVNRNTFKLHRYAEFQHPDTLVKMLYGDFDL